MEELGWGFAAVKVFGLAIGVVAGGYMIWIACHKWKLDAVFWAGGAGLSSLGVVLIGLSMWKSVEVNLQVEEGLTLKLEAALKELKRQGDALEENNRVTSLLNALMQTGREEVGQGLVVYEASTEQKREAAEKVRSELRSELWRYCTMQSSRPACGIAGTVQKSRDEGTRRHLQDVLEERLKSQPKDSLDDASERLVIED